MYIHIYEMSVFSSGLAFCCDLSLPFCHILTLTIQYLAYTFYSLYFILYFFHFTFYQPNFIPEVF